jgi:hypothetical protein
METCISNSRYVKPVLIQKEELDAIRFSKAYAEQELMPYMPSLVLLRNWVKEVKMLKEEKAKNR